MDVVKLTVFTAKERELREVMSAFVAQWKEIVEWRKDAETAAQDNGNKLIQLKASKPSDEDFPEAQEWIEDIEDLEQAGVCRNLQGPTT